MFVNAVGYVVHPGAVFFQELGDWAFGRGGFQEFNLGFPYDKKGDFHFLADNLLGPGEESCQGCRGNRKVPLRWRQLLCQCG